MSYPFAPARPISARTVIRPLLTVALLWACVAVTTYISLMTLTGQSLDDVALAQAEADRNNFFPWIFLAAAQRVPELVSFAAAILAIVWTVHTRRWVPALIALFMILGANVSTQFLKRVVLEKPDFGIQHIVHNSFPSGHTTATATILVALLLVAPPRLRARTATWGWILAAITGMLTVLNGWHRPSDAAAALLIVGGWGVLAVLAIRVADTALSRSGNTPGARPAQLYRQFRQNMAARKNTLQYRDDRGESAYIPPGNPGHGDRARQEPYGGAAAPRAASYGWAPQPQNGHGQVPYQGGRPIDPYGRGQHWQQGRLQYGGPYGQPRYGVRKPVRPGRGMVITLLVVSIGLSVTVALLPSVAVAGTGTGRALVIAGYLGIAAAAALSWRAVTRWLRFQS